MKKSFILVFSVILFTFLLAVMAKAEIVESCECGPTMSWAINDEGVLTISGSGYMTSKPWKSANHTFDKVIIEEGVKNH